MVTQEKKPTLVLGGTGKTGRRVVQRLQASGHQVRVGSRSGNPPFDREDQATWAPPLLNVGAVHLTYYQDLAVPGAVETIRAFTELAMANGIQRLVLPSGRGEPRDPVRAGLARGACGRIDRARRAARGRGRPQRQHHGRRPAGSGPGAPGLHRLCAGGRRRCLERLERPGALSREFAK